MSSSDLCPCLGYERIPSVCKEGHRRRRGVRSGGKVTEKCTRDRQEHLEIHYKAHLAVVMKKHIFSQSLRLLSLYGLRGQKDTKNGKDGILFNLLDLFYH